MAVIDAKGLFFGDRLKSCSDLAQLHWPRLFAAGNALGRVELSYAKLLATVYSSFSVKPTETEVNRLIEEYANNFLLFIYQVDDGSVWGQWMTPARYLSKYHTAEDRRSPSPDQASLDEYVEQYHASKKTKYLNIKGVSKPHQTTSNHIEPPRTTSVGIGIGIGIGKEQKPPSARDEVCEIPEGLPAMSYARGLLENCGIPVVPPTLAACGAAVTAYAGRAKIPLNLATMELTALVKAAQSSGKVVTKFWFEDSGWVKHGTASEPKVNGNVTAIRSAVDRYTGGNSRAVAGTDGREVSAPEEHARSGDGRVSPGLRSTGPPVRDGTSTRRPDGAAHPARGEVLPPA